MIKQINEIQKTTEKMHLESETLKQKNTEIMQAIDGLSSSHF
jgi:uncharacterized protein YaaN involved in tellurite resistance